MKLKNVVILFCLLGGQLIANPCRYTIYAEWLYFRPSLDTNFVSESATVGALSTGKARSVNPHHHSGWRVGLNYQIDCKKRLCFRWSQLNTRKTRHFVGSNFNSIAGGVGPSTVTDTLKFNYHAFEAVYGANLLKSCDYFVDLIAGVHYARVGVNERLRITPFTIAPSSAKQLGHFRGVGPELGIDVIIPIFCGFSIMGSGTGSLLVSRLHEKVHATNPAPTIIENRIDSIWRVVPAWNFRAAVKYDCFLTWLHLYAEAGYEILSYVRGLRLMNTSINVNTFEYSNADMHGPFIALGITY